MIPPIDPPLTVDEDCPAPAGGFRRRRLRPAAVVLAAALTLAACGGGSSDQAEPVADAIAAATALAQQPADPAADAGAGAPSSADQSTEGSAAEKAAKPTPTNKPAAKFASGAKGLASEQPAERANRRSNPAPVVPAPAPTGVLPDLQVVQVSTGQTVGLRDLAVTGKPTLLWFWAPHCPICKAEAPKLVDFSERYGDKIQIVGLGAQDDFALAEEFVAETGTQNLQMVWDSSGKSWLHYRVTNQPTVIVLDREGEVKQTWFRKFDEPGIRRAAEIE